jgi:hypothetical protein
VSAAEVTALVLRERQTRDRGWYEDMADCFATDSVVEMSWYTGSGAGFLKATKGLADRGDIAVHRLNPAAVRIRGDRALAELPLVIERDATATACGGSFESPPSMRRTRSHRRTLAPASTSIPASWRPTAPPTDSWPGI